MSFMEFRFEVIGFLFRDIDTFREKEKKNPKAYLTNAWVMNEGSNRKLCISLEEALMSGVDDRFILRCLYLGVNKLKKGIQYPVYLKSKKNNVEEWQFLKNILKQYYKLGSKEMNYYFNNLFVHKLKNDKFKESMAKKMGLNNELRKKIGLKPIKFDKKKIKVVKGVFDYA